MVAAKGLALGLSLALAEGDRTPYLLFLAQEEIDRLVALCETHWTALLETARQTAADQAADQGGADSAGRSERQAGPRTRRRQTESSADAKLAAQLRPVFTAALDGARAVDLALFGRMVADRPEVGVDAACQVAHAISTHAVPPEFDFYTAVDDLQPREEPGAGMMGTLEFNAACFYRYANVDTTQLLANLKGDHALARQALAAFIGASVRAVPSGKQNSMAAYHPPALVLVRVQRAAWPWNLANAFVRPARPSDQEDLTTASIRQLFTHLRRLEAVYGHDGRVYQGFVSLEEAAWQPYEGDRVATLAELVAAAVDHAVPESV